MYKSSFTSRQAASRNKSKVRSKSVAARLPVAERTRSPDAQGRSARDASRAREAVAAASSSLVAASSAAAAAAPASASEFPPRDFKDDVMALSKEGLLKFLKFMPPLSKARQAAGDWDVPTLLARVDSLYDSLDERIRLLPSHPQNLLQRKRTLACNLCFSVCPYEDVNPAGQRAEFNRLFGARRDNGPTRLTDQYVPEKIKQHIEKMKGTKGGRMEAKISGGKKGDSKAQSMSD